MTTDLETIKEGRAIISAVQEELSTMEQVEMPPSHYHAKDLYGREITIPAGTLLVGKIHKHQSLNILLKGSMSILTEQGAKRIEAPYTVVSEPGIKRLGYAHEESVWLCVHGTKETDLELIEKDVIAEDYDDVEYLEHQAQKLLSEIDKES